MTCQCAWPFPFPLVAIQANLIVLFVHDNSNYFRVCIYTGNSWKQVLTELKIIFISKAIMFISKLKSAVINYVLIGQYIILDTN